MPSQALVLLLQIVTLAGSALTAFKLHRTRLRFRYPVFFWYLVFLAANGTWPLFLSPRADLYEHLWVCTEPISWTFYVLVVRELCGLVLAKHQGLTTLGRWAMYAGIALSVTTTLITLIPRIRPAAPQRTKILGYLLAADRGVTLALAVFLLVMMFLLRGYPVLLSRNVVLHVSLYTIFFISNTLAVVLASMLGHDLYMWVDTGLMVVSVACILSWLFFLTPAGEEERVNLPHFRPELEERILTRLDALNATTLKIAGK
jgi:hypothetical protein